MKTWYVFAATIASVFVTFATTAAAAPADSPAILDRDAVAREIGRQMDALRASGLNSDAKAAQMARYELYLAALDALAREELVKLAALRVGDRAAGNLALANADARRLALQLDRGASR